MRESAARLLERIRLGEDSALELKQVTLAGDKVRGPRQDDLADEMAAFANARGGTLVLGVEDRRREILGVPRERLDVVMRHVRQAARDAVKPSLFIDVDRYELPDAEGNPRCVLRVEVPRGLTPHRSPGGYFRRVGDAKHQMSTDALLRLSRQRSQAGASFYDEEVVARASFGDLDGELVDRFRTELTEDDRGTLATKLGMAAESEDGELRPTIAGVLLGARSPERWLPNAVVQAVAYRGRSVGEAMDHGNYQLDAQELVGPLDRQIAETCKFVAKNQRVGASKNVGRTDHPQYGMTAVFEAVVNAVAHRDYSIHTSKVRLRMFSDRLELDSPGELANTLTLDSLAYRQASRNNTVASLLARCRVPEGIPGLETPRATLMDRRGEGVGVILRESEAVSGRRPVYELFGDSELRLVIFAAGEEP